MAEQAILPHLCHCESSMARPAILKDRNCDCHCEEAVFADEAISNAELGIASQTALAMTIQVSE